MVKSQPYQGSFQNTYSKIKTNIRLWMYTWKGTVWYLFCLVWSSISCFKDENVSHKSPMCTSDKITTVPRLFSEHSLQNEKKNIRLWMYTLNGIVWYLFCLDWSSISCFRDENVSHKSPMCISGKITTIPGLFSEHLLQDKNKHQIMDVHMKWNCLIPILSGLVKY